MAVGILRYESGVVGHMDGWMLGAAALYTAGFYVLLRTVRHNRQRYPVVKGIQSSLFVAVGVLSWLTGQHHAPAVFSLLLGGLLACALGDVLLGVANRTPQVRARPFLAGTLCFLLAHLLFCAAFAPGAPAAWWDVLPAVGVAAWLRVQEARGWIRLKKMRVLGYTYALLVGYMCTRAVRCGLASAAPAFTWLTCAGAVLFLLSDTVLLYLYFGTWRPRWLRTANLASYYTGILLLALSTHWY